MLKLMYITNDPAVAVIAANAGVDRIFIDMEVLGKEKRQKGFDSVKSHHTPADIAAVRRCIGSRAEIVARIDPLHEKSKEQIDASIDSGADILMLPMWKKAGEIQTFLRLVNDRCRTMLLLETAEAAEGIEEIVRIPGINEIHIGLNDLHLSYCRRFMFELLADGTVERLMRIIRQNRITCGFGGIARLGGGMLPAELILGEHYRMHSEIVILSRSFCDTAKTTDRREIERQFEDGVAEIRQWEQHCASWTKEQFSENQRRVKECVRQILANGA